jgi:hypothetical protein
MARIFVPSQNADTQGHGRPRTHLQALVLDVLAMVSERIAPDDMIAWRLVNRTHAVVTEPYRYCKLVFRTPTRTRDACALLAREPAYARRLQSLAVYEECLGAEDERKELIALVVGLVRRATGLHVLRFENAQDWLGRTGFLDALVSCTQLETLELVQRARVLDPLWHSTHVLFAQLRAPLRVLKLHALGGDGFPAHIFALLKHVAPTLEELDMCNVDIGRWLDRVPVPKPPPVFPCLRTLRMETRSHVHLPTLESAFPAVRALRIKLQGAIHNQLSDYFAQNRPQAPAYWRQLHVLEGDIGGLRSLGLNGAQVDLLSVDAAPVNALDSAALAEVLRGVSPEMLRLLVWPKDEAENVQVYGEYIAPSVRVLELQVSSRSWSLPRILTASSSMEFAMAFMVCAQTMLRASLTASAEHAPTTTSAHAFTRVSTCLRRRRRYPERVLRLTSGRLAQRASRACTNVLRGRRQSLGHHHRCRLPSHDIPSHRPHAARRRGHAYALLRGSTC